MVSEIPHGEPGSEARDPRIVQLGERFSPFQPPFNRRVTLQSGVIPDLQFNASNGMSIITVGADATSLRRSGVLRSTGWNGRFTPEFIDEVIGLSLSVTSPEGEYEARLNTHHLTQGAITFWTFTRTTPQGEIDVWIPSVPRSREYLAQIDMTFILKEENRHKLPGNPETPAYDPNEVLEALIAERTKGDSLLEKQAREEILGQPSMLDFVLNGPMPLIGGGRLHALHSQVLRDFSNKSKNQ